MKICVNCVLPETFPSINFDEKGICNYCRSFKGKENIAENKEKYREKFEKLLATYKGKADYDILMAYSGGKDSTYTLDLFKNYFGLRVLAITFDHGFVSPFAMQNIKKVVERLNIDHITFRPNFEFIKKIFNKSITEELYPKKSLERASTICSSCMNLVKFITIKIALEKNIPFIGYGWSPGQAPLQSSVMKINANFVKEIQKVLFEPLHAALGAAIRPYFLPPDFFNRGDGSFPYNIHPLAFLEYDENKIYKRIYELGWKPPEDTDANSTNCLMNSYANKIHLERYGFHPYAFEISGLVRMGILAREEGLRRLEESGDEKVINQVKEKLGL
ncbi:MAG: phosphoadenosine phosphosulfate reductase family protein [Thermodesulfobacteriota bacterium]